MLQRVSSAETLLDLEHYRAEFARGRFEATDVQLALNEYLERAGEDEKRPFDSRLVEETVWNALCSTANRAAESPTQRVDQRSQGRVRTVAELADNVSAWRWSEWVQGELTKFCSAYFDEGQAAWRGRDPASGVWAAWRRRARHDRNPQIWGLGTLRSLAERLGEDEFTAVEALLQQLQIPEELLETYLLCEVQSMPGWFSWVRLRADWRHTAAPVERDFVGLLAVRLAYAAALAQSLNLQIDWSTWSAAGEGKSETDRDDAVNSLVRTILLRASEIGFRRRLLVDLKPGQASINQENNRPDAQVVFCIDVRSERLRRHLESLSGKVQTRGFAGFFGIPCEYKKWGDSPERKADSQLPVLLTPQLLVQEELREVTEQEIADCKLSRGYIRSWRAAWKQFQGSLASCFSFVETTGWTGGLRLLRRSLGLEPTRGASGRFDGLREDQAEFLGPGLRGLNSQGWSTTRLADLAEGVLRNMGLREVFARLIVLCGHRSEVTNNPLQASLDCGACGGHSGEANARFAALLLNQEFIRRELAERGLQIPSDTFFTAAVHQTTSDELEFPDAEQVPFSHAKDLARLRELCRRAGELTAVERGERLQLGSREEISRRSQDWSEVRPEWGLAGNAAFVAGPRELTRGRDLAGRAFLHDYDWRQDEQGQVLELILTAPLVVASWINLQYYASAVDNRRYGSGCKTIHNVVGKFGILSG
ncbi:MAG: putative inorganic carbon transporter subunit DabA, partial [Planctomycetota bacterium]